MDRYQRRRNPTVLIREVSTWERIGLSSAQVALDYGDPANARDHKHGDFVFRADDKGPKELVVFMNSTGGW